MEVIRKFIDANSLMSIMALPEAFRNRKLEVIVLPTMLVMQFYFT